MQNLFKVDGQTLIPIEIYPAVSDTVNYLTFAFMFSYDWDGLTKSAIFTKGTDIFEVVLTDDEVLESDHVNLSAGVWEISVVGDTVVDAVVTRQITTSSYNFNVTQASATSGGVFPPSIASQVYINTNQATPQTFVGGIPKLAADRVIDQDNEIVDKKHVDDTVASVTADDFDHNDLANKQGGTTNEYYHVTSAEKTVIEHTSGTNTGDQVLPTRDSLGLGTDDTVTFANLSGTNTGDQDVDGAISTHNSDVNAHADLFALATAKTYGCFFVGSASAGNRFGSADGLIANVGVDATPVVNSFDSIYPWSLMKPANTAIVNGVRVPTHFKGEVGFDALAADVYVYVPIYYKSRRADDGALQISAKPLPEFLPPSKFINADGTYRPYVFLPAYTAGLVGGVPVSRSGYYPHITSLNGWMSLLASCHTAGTLDQDIWISGMQDREILLDLMEIEFATRDHQTIMQGATSMRYAADQTTAGGVNQFTVSTACAAALAVGQAIAIGTTDKGDQVTTNATILTINTTTGVVTFAPTGADVTVATGNYISSRLWKSGACDAVVASSGSPVSNTSGIYPCKYRGVENPYGNTYQWLWDILINEHAPFVLLDPTKYAAGALTADYKALSYVLPSTDGYATEMGFDSAYPFVRLTKSVGGSSTTYFADYYYQAAGLRALYVGGAVPSGRYAGARSFIATIGPSYSYWTIGASLSPA